MQEAPGRLAMIAQRFRFRLVADAEIEPVPWITLRPSHGLPMRFERRAFDPNPRCREHRRRGFDGMLDPFTAPIAVKYRGESPLRTSRRGEF